MLEIAEGFNELDGLRFFLEDFVNGVTARNNQDIVVLEIFMSVFVVNTGLDGKARGGGYACRSCGDGAFEGFAC